MNESMPVCVCAHECVSGTLIFGIANPLSDTSWTVCQWDFFCFSSSQRDHLQTSNRQQVCSPGSLLCASVLMYGPCPCVQHVLVCMCVALCADCRHRMWLHTEELYSNDWEEWVWTVCPHKYYYLQWLLLHTGKERLLCWNVLFISIYRNDMVIIGSEFMFCRGSRKVNLSLNSMKTIAE